MVDLFPGFPSRQKLVAHRKKFFFLAWRLSPLALKFADPSQRKPTCTREPVISHFFFARYSESVAYNQSDRKSERVVRAVFPPKWSVFQAVDPLSSTEKSAIFVVTAASRMRMSLGSRAICHTVSKAFLMSNETAATCLLESSTEIVGSVNRNYCRIVESFVRNSDCKGERKLPIR